MKDKIFIVPQNDLEAVEIIKMLKEQGYEESKDLFITKQGWGASWDGLEPEIKEMLEENSKRTKEKMVTEVKKSETPLTLDTPVRWYHSGNIKISPPGTFPQYIWSEKASSFEGTYREYLNDDEKNNNGFERADDITETTTIVVPDVVPVYGVELKGNPPYECIENIDHHSYCDKNWETGETIYEDDRTNPKSSIEQVSHLLNTTLSIEQKFIAANDRGFVEEMKKIGESMGMDKEVLSALIKETRMKEHAILAEVQGITSEMEQQAEEAIKNAYVLDNGTMVVNLSHSKCATVTDRIPEQEYDGGLLIVCGDGEIDYYGPSSKVQELNEKFGGWTGDTKSEYTFWGNGESLNPEEVINLIETERNKEKEDIEEYKETKSPKKSIFSKIKAFVATFDGRDDDDGKFGGAAMDALDKEGVDLTTDNGPNKEIGE